LNYFAHTNCFSVREGKGKMIILKRIKIGDCILCKKTEHTSDNGFITLSGPKNNAHFYCYRANKTDKEDRPRLFLGSVTPQAKSKIALGLEFDIFCYQIYNLNPFCNTK